MCTKLLYSRTRSWIYCVHKQGGEFSTDVVSLKGGFLSPFCWKYTWGYKLNPLSLLVRNYKHFGASYVLLGFSGACFPSSWISVAWKSFSGPDLAVSFLGLILLSYRVVHTLRMLQLEGSRNVTRTWSYRGCVCQQASLSVWFIFKRLTKFSGLVLVMVLLITFHYMPSVFHVWGP